MKTPPNVREYQRRWYSLKREDPEFLRKRAEQAREGRKRNPEKRLLQGAKDRARTKNLPIDIELSDIKIPDNCPILGVPLELGTPYAPSLDRIVPSEGYTKGNVWVISRKANAMKQDASKEELERFAEWVKTSQRS